MRGFSAWQVGGHARELPGRSRVKRRLALTYETASTSTRQAAAQDWYGNSGTPPSFALEEDVEEPVVRLELEAEAVPPEEAVVLVTMEVVELVACEVVLVVATVETEEV